MENTSEKVSDQGSPPAESAPSERKATIREFLSDVGNRIGEGMGAMFDYLGSDRYFDNERRLGQEMSEVMFNKIMKPPLIAESKINIWRMRFFRGENNNLADSLFDKIRKLVIGLARVNLPAYLELLGIVDSEKIAAVQRWFFSIYIDGIVDSAKGNGQLDASMRGIAWSLLAQDARQVLKTRAQTIDGSWLFDTMGPLIRSRQDQAAFQLELSRFVSGDPEVIHTAPL